MAKKTWYQWCGTRSRSGIHKAYVTCTLKFQVSSLNEFEIGMQAYSQ